MNNLIPKNIHYIWLGKKPLDKLSIKCMATWKKVLPDYTIVKWNDENSIDIINKNKYASQAYKAGKFAFVSDYLRLYILYNYGGIYMDTDVQVIKNLDCFLSHSAFSSFQSETMIPTALMASKKNGFWVGQLLEYYSVKQFVNLEGKFDYTTNVEIITKMSESFGLIRNGKYQVLEGDVHIYPREYFCPLDVLDSKNNNITKNTYALHLYNGSWTPFYRRFLSRIKKQLGINPKKLLGKKIYDFLSKKY